MTDVLTQSYTHGTSDVPLIGETIGEHFDAVAARWADRDALLVRHQDISWTWGELKARVDDFAAGLIALGLQPGSRIGIWSLNNAEWVITQFATAKAGTYRALERTWRDGDTLELEHPPGGRACAAQEAVGRRRQVGRARLLRRRGGLP